MSFMHPKIKNRPAIGKTQGLINTVEPLLPHEVTNQNASAVAASRRRIDAKQTASPIANHARHHVSRQTQS
jgi:hypothetical protein